MSSIAGTAMMGCGMLVRIEMKAHFVVDIPSDFKGRDTAIPSGILWIAMAKAMINPNCIFPVAKPTPMAIPSGMEWMNIVIKTNKLFFEKPFVKILEW